MSTRESSRRCRGGRPRERRRTGSGRLPEDNIPMPVLPEDITPTELLATVIVNSVETIRRRLEELGPRERWRLERFERILRHLDEAGHIEGTPPTAVWRMG